MPYLDKELKGSEFIKKNKIILIGLLSVLGIYIIPSKDKFSYPYFEGICLAFLIFVVILGLCMFLLFRQQRIVKKSKSETSFSNKNNHH